MRTTPQQILGGPILPTLLRLSVPAIIAFTFHTTFNFVDRLFVSRLGAVELGALGMAFTVQSILITIGSGTGIGASSLVARFIGAGKKEQANNAAEHTLLIILALSVLFTIAGPLLSRPLFVLLGASEQMLPYILSYVNIILYGSFFQFFAMIGNGILRGEGNTVTPMQVMVVGTLVNIVLDPLLIFGIGPFPALGVQGAAIATVIGRAVSCIVLAASLFGKKNIVVLNMRAFRYQGAIIRGIFAVGGPTVMGQLSNSLGLTLLFILLKPYGDMAKSAFTLGFTYQQVAVLPIIGIAQGTLTMTGQNFGAGKIRRVKSLIKKSLLFCMGLMCAFALVMILGRGAFVRVFSDLPEVIRIGRTMLLIFAVGFPFLAARFILSSFFQGLGKGFAAFLINFSYILIFAMPLALLLSRLIGIEGIWIGIVAGNLLSSVLGAGWAGITGRRLESGIEEPQPIIIRAQP
ncbi:MAG: MATE family efflux transporter [Spirochaetaceae bacterium]|nr:MAG: MATE family efflux transporter [Spirochaetaceae bacterium]